MSIEIPNRIHAAGLFNLADPPEDFPINGNTEEIPSSMGVAPVDPSTNPAGPIVGGFTRVDSGSYVLGLLDGLDLGEFVPIVQLPNNLIAAFSPAAISALMDAESKAFFSLSVFDIDTTAQLIDDTATFTWAQISWLRFTTGTDLTEIF